MIVPLLFEIKLWIALSVLEPLYEFPVFKILKLIGCRYLFKISSFSSFIHHKNVKTGHYIKLSLAPLIFVTKKS